MCGFDLGILQFEIYSFLRRKIFNISSILTILPPIGKILDLGCGYGTLDFELVESGNYGVTGVDSNRKRISVAEKVILAKNISSLDFICADALEFLISSHESYDVVLAVDLFHHVPHSYHLKMLGLIYNNLTSKGSFILKDIGLYPRYKYLINYAHDKILNRSDKLYCREVQEWMRIMRDTGFTTEYFPVSSWSSFFYPHFILKGTKNE